MLRHFFLFILSFQLILANAYGEDLKLSISAEAFGQRENFLKIKLSPNGNRMASLRSYKGKISLVTQSLDPSVNGQSYVTTFKEGEFKWFRWLNNDRLAVSIRFPSRRYGSDSIETRLFAQDWDRKNPINLIKRQKRMRSRELTRWVSQLQDDVVSFLPDDPDHILLALDGDRVNYPDVYKINVHTGDRARVVKSRASVMDWMADKKGVVRLGISQYKSKNRLIYREDEGESWKTIAKYDVIDDDIPFHPVGFSPDPKVIYVSKLNEKGFQAYYKYNLERGEFGEKIAGKDDANVTSIDIDEAGNIRSYTYLDQVYHRVNKDKLWQSMAKMLDKNFPDQDAYVTSYSKDKKKFVIHVSSPTNPGDYYFLDLNTVSLGWYAETYYKLDVSKLSPMKPVTYQARDGLDIPAYLSLPIGVKDPKNLPTIIMPHGGPFARDSYGFDYWVQFLTTRGYAVLQMNYRGSTGYGAYYEELGRNEWGGKMLDDINDGARWMIEQGYSDPGRMCIVGGSYGGYAALQTLIKEPDLYKCSVAFAPVTSMAILFRNAKKYIGLKDRYLPYIRNEEGSLSDISPYSNIDKINVPVLLVHETEDRSVDYKHGEMFAKRMKKKKKDIRFITLEEGDHHLSQQKHRIKFLQEMEKFLEKNL